MVSTRSGVFAKLASLLLSQCVCLLLLLRFNLFSLLFIDFTEKQKHQLFDLFMDSLVAPCICPDWGSNPQP